MRTLITTLLLALALTACDSDDDAPPPVADPATTVVTVSFRDSSVAPDHHRSWQLTLDREQIAVVVDSYGDVVSEGSVSMPAGQWQEFVEALPEEVEALGEPQPAEEGCTGGTGLTLEVQGEWSEKLAMDNCANDTNTAITHAVLELVAPFTEAVDLDERTATH